MAVTALVDEQESDARYRMGLVLVRIIKEAYLEKGNLDTVFEVLFTGYRVGSNLMIKDSEELKTIVKLLLELNTDINARNNHGRSVLSQCIDHCQPDYIQFHPVYDENHKSIVRLLLEKGADVSIIDFDGYTALHHALFMCCNTEIIKMLVRAGSPLESRTEAGETPLYFALRNYNKDSISFLIQSGVNINSSIPNFDEEDKIFSPLEGLLSAMGEAGIDDTYLLRLFLQKGADVNFCDSNGDSILQYAVFGECEEEIIRMFVRFGAVINHKNHAGQTVLHTAVKWTPLLIPCLIECGADPFIADNKGKIPFDIYTGDDESIAKLLSARKPNQ